MVPVAVRSPGGSEPEPCLCHFPRVAGRVGYDPAARGCSIAPPLVAHRGRHAPVCRRGRRSLHAGVSVQPIHGHLRGGAKRPMEEK